MSASASLSAQPPATLPERVSYVPQPAIEISRAALVNRLRANRSAALASIVAPPGYGKTALLSQWVERDARAFRFVRLGADRTDAATLVAAVVAAVDGIAPVDLPRAGRRPDDWVWRAAVPRIGAALRTADRPFVLVLDDAHLLADDAAEVVTALLEDVPENSLVALAGSGPALRSLPRLRAGGAVLELGSDDLAFSRREARLLLNGLGVSMSDDQLDMLLETTEGWAAGIVAAAHSLASPQGDLLPSPLAKLLAGLAPGEREFLRRTSILDQLSAPLCDALLERQRSADVLASLEKRGLFLVPLDREREWFRYHRAFREHLRNELEELEPERVPLLEARAADWFEAAGDRELALGYARAAGDVERVAGLLLAVAGSMYNGGRAADLLDLLARLEESAGLESFPRLAMLAARLNALHGNAEEAERRLADAARSVSSQARGKRRSPDRLMGARIAIVRAGLCPNGLDSMLADVEQAVARLPGDDPWRPYGLLLQGTAHALLGHVDTGDAILSRAVHAAERLGSTETRVIALTERSLLAAARGASTAADALLDRALETIAANGLETYPTCALTLTVSARSQLLHCQAQQASEALASAARLAASLGRALPWLGVQTRLELAGAQVTLRNSEAARRELRGIDEILRECPKLGVLRAQRRLLAAEIDAMPANGRRRVAGLTEAELRLLPMLATHLSFREIGSHFFLSRNTVKTQAISVYRKLGASSRGEAVLEAQRLGLVGNAADHDLIPTG